MLVGQEGEIRSFWDIINTGRSTGRGFEGVEEDEIRDS